MPSFTLTCQSSVMAIRSWAVSLDGLTIGREEGFCDVCLPANALAVSRQHARISLSPDSCLVLIEDLGSKNGTWVKDHGKVSEEDAFSTATSVEFWLGTQEWSFVVSRE
jgi:hypothetical protein